MREGVLGPTTNPFVEVLQMEIMDSKRQASDLLPYIPDFRPLFSQLPKNASQVRVSVAPVHIEDVEAVTDTLVKFNGPHWYLKIPKGKL